jgi:hypothetical protein
MKDNASIYKAARISKLVSSLWFFFFIVLRVDLLSADYKDHSIKYLYPLPYSKLVSPWTTIIVRFNNDTGLNNTEDIRLTVMGQKSGNHSGQTILTEDKHSFLFKPLLKFESGEQVYFDIRVRGKQIHFSSSFTISPKSFNPKNTIEQGDTTSFQQKASIHKNEIRIINGVSVPGNFPVFKPGINIQPSDGLLFLSNYSTRIFMILKNDGTPYFYRKSNSNVWDFTVQADNVLTYMEGATAKVLNDHFEVVRTYKCGHGYLTDHHEFKLLPNGHGLLIAKDTQIIDMSELVPDGKINAKVIGNHIQEVNMNKEVVFEWRCWDHFQILDAPHQKLTGITIDYVHMNAIDIDYDGHILVSSRFLDEITKINRETGDIIWRLGGRNNQFEFLNDPDGFSYQHDIRAVPDKPNHYTLFDNGNHHTPNYSRIVEYKLDIDSMTAEIVWEYRHSPDRYSHWMGNAQRLSNGNTVIGWSYKKLPKITEITSDGTIVYEGDYYKRNTCYRVHRFHCNKRAIRPYLLVNSSDNTKVTLIFNQFGDPNVQKFRIYADIMPDPVTQIDSTSNTYIHLTNLTNLTKYYFRVTSVDSSGIESDFSNEVSTNVKYIPSGDNMLFNGDFSQLLEYWTLSIDSTVSAQWEIDNLGQFHVDVLKESNKPSDVSLIQSPITLFEGKTYRLEFEGYSDQSRIVEIKIENPVSLYDYGRIGLANFTSIKKKYSFDFVMEYATDDEARLAFNFAYSTGDAFLDNIFLSEISSSVDDNNRTKQHSRYWLSKNFPNPFNNSTTIRYYLPFNSQVELSFLNTLGRVVHNVRNEKQTRGEYQYRFDARHLSSGVYFCRFRAYSLTNKHQFLRTIKLINMP